MDNYSEAEFIDGFMEEYNSGDEYDITEVFDIYYNDFISDRSRYFMYTMYRYYNYDYDIRSPFCENVLYDVLYEMIENMMIDNDDSEADTETDE